MLNDVSFNIRFLSNSFYSSFVYPILLTTSSHFVDDFKPHNNNLTGARGDDAFVISIKALAPCVQWSVGFK